MRPTPPPPVFVVCRLASNSLLPGSKRGGYHCRKCSVEVQVSPHGQTQIAAGGIALCNDCAAPLFRTSRIVLNPAVDGQIAREAAKSATPANVVNVADSANVAEPKGQYNSTRHTEILPSGTLQEVEVRSPAVAAETVCDCCLRKADRQWYYAHRAFCPWPPGEGRRSFELAAGEWGMCVFCHTLYAKGDIESLIARVHTLQPDLDRRFLSDVYRLMPHVFTGAVEEPDEEPDVLHP